MLLDTGLRASELLGLQVGDFDVHSGRLMVEKGKGGKQRVVFLGVKARKGLLHHLVATNPGSATHIFLSERGGKLTYFGLAQMIRRRCKRAGVQPVSPHSFRRAFALASLRGGMDVYSLQKLMGHSDLSTLRRYLAQTEDDLRQAHAKSSPADHLL